MKSHDKTVLISGMMFNAVFFLLMLAELVITKAAGIGLFTALATYVFFDQCYYKIKDWLLSANSKQSETNKMNFNSIIQWEDKSCKR